MQRHGKIQPSVWILLGLIAIAALAIIIILLKRPEATAYQDAIWVFKEVPWI